MTCFSSFIVIVYIPECLYAFNEKKGSVLFLSSYRPSYNDQLKYVEHSVVCVFGGCAHFLECESSIIRQILGTHISRFNEITPKNTQTIISESCIPFAIDRIHISMLLHVHGYLFSFVFFLSTLLSSWLLSSSPFSPSVELPENKSSYALFVDDCNGRSN